MKITIKNVSERPQVLDLTKIIAFRTVISSGNSYSLNLREDKIILIKEHLMNNEIFKILEDEKKIEISKSEKIEETKSEKVEEAKPEEITEEIIKDKEETKIDSKKKSSKRKSK